VDGDEGLVFGARHLGQVGGRLLDEGVEDGEELVVGGGHDLLVGAGVLHGLR